MSFVLFRRKKGWQARSPCITPSPPAPAVCSGSSRFCVTTPTQFLSSISCCLVLKWLTFLGMISRWQIPSRLSRSHDRFGAALQELGLPVKVVERDFLKDPSVLRDSDFLKLSPYGT